eukprot:360772-Chlamydomonas_euryale.AAC.13
MRGRHARGDDERTSAPAQPQPIPSPPAGCPLPTMCVPARERVCVPTLKPTPAHLRGRHERGDDGNRIHLRLLAWRSGHTRHAASPAGRDDVLLQAARTDIQ